MARPLRIEYEGAVYHVTSRGNERKPIFKEDTDRSLFLDILHKVNKRYNLLCHAYCLMDNHYHLIIETPEGNLSKGMRQLNGVYTIMFNKKHKRVGHIYQGRYKVIFSCFGSPSRNRSKGEREGALFRLIQPREKKFHLNIPFNKSLTGSSSCFFPSSCLSNSLSISLSAFFFITRLPAFLISTV